MTGHSTHNHSTDYAARWWTREGDRVVCSLCPRNCQIPDGGRGFCFVRQNRDHKLVLTTYGKSTGFCIDPIEKKPLNHFLPGTPILSFGTAGCNLGCKFCQNWDISKAKDVEILSEEASPEQIIQAALTNNCRSIAFTYNDPVIWAEYAIDVANEARAAGVKTVAVTAGYIGAEARPEFFRNIDATNVDLKAFTESFYRDITSSHIQPVLDTLKWLKHESDVWVEITNLVIPGHNDSDDELKRMCEWVSRELSPDTPLHFSAFHPDYKLQAVPATPVETLRRARDIALSEGIHYAYVGNCHDLEGQSTYCPNCRALIIERDWYRLGEINLRDGKCRECDHQIAGHFENEVGTWGPKRQPISIPTNDDAAIVQLRRSKALRSRVNAAEKLAEKYLDRMTPQPELRSEFNAEEQAALLAYTRDVIRTVLSATENNPSLNVVLSDSRVYGLFVTLKRGGLLRACRGRWGVEEGMKLGAAIREISTDTVLEDPRFPRISADELDFCEIELSILHSPSTLDVSDESVSANILIGTHGLVLIHPRGRGLLLPQVAEENEWDPLTFLAQLSRKAGLDSSAWRQGTLLSFQAAHFASPPSLNEIDVYSLNESFTSGLSAALRRIDGDTSVDANGVFFSRVDNEIGIEIELRDGERQALFLKGVSLFELLSELCARIGKPLSQLKLIRMMVCPIRLIEADYPSRVQILLPYAARGEYKGRTALFAPPASTTIDPIPHILESLGASQKEFKRGNVVIDTFRVKEILIQQGEANLASDRPPAVAGYFYPLDAEECRNSIKRYLGKLQPEVSPLAIMLPHAGWSYCGEISGHTLRNVALPKHIIIFSPKHTANGPIFSVSSAAHWILPTGTLKVSDQLRRMFLELLPNAPVEAEAHRSEHGVEVILPFLQHLRPDIEILPIVVGPLTEDDAIEIGKRISPLLSDETLIVISSDMNHFDAEDETRRKDLLALAALETGDAHTLLQTCKDERISMCGAIPAAIVLSALHAANLKVTVHRTAYGTSAATNNDYGKVVGYAGAHIRR